MSCRKRKKKTARQVAHLGIRCRVSQTHCENKAAFSLLSDAFFSLLACCEWQCVCLCACVREKGWQQSYSFTVVYTEQQQSRNALCIVHCAVHLELDAPHSTDRKGQQGSSSLNCLNVREKERKMLCRVSSHYLSPPLSTSLFISPPRRPRTLSLPLRLPIPTAYSPNSQRTRAISGKSVQRSERCQRTNTDASIFLFLTKYLKRRTKQNKKSIPRQTQRESGLSDHVGPLPSRFSFLFFF